MKKAFLLTILLSISKICLSQNPCINLYCDDSSWLENQIQIIDDEVAQAPALGVGICNSGRIRMCMYNDQPVYTYLQTVYICDIPTSVVDCDGNFIFRYGGFCPPPGCPGDTEAALLMDCVTLYSTSMTDAEFCSAPISSAIPTLGEWGMACLFLSLTILGVVSLREYAINHQVV